jgi:hypothetical protein
MSLKVRTLKATQKITKTSLRRLPSLSSSLKSSTLLKTNQTMNLTRRTRKRRIKREKMMIKKKLTLIK